MVERAELERAAARYRSVHHRWPRRGDSPAAPSEPASVAQSGAEGSEPSRAQSAIQDSPARQAAREVQDRRSWMSSRPSQPPMVVDAEFVETVDDAPHEDGTSPTWAAESSAIELSAARESAITPRLPPSHPGAPSRSSQWLLGGVAAAALGGLVWKATPPRAPELGAASPTSVDTAEGNLDARTPSDDETTKRERPRAPTRVGQPARKKTAQGNHIQSAARALAPEPLKLRAAGPTPNRASPDGLPSESPSAQSPLPASVQGRPEALEESAKAAGNAALPLPRKQKVGRRPENPPQNGTRDGIIRQSPF